LLPLVLLACAGAGNGDASELGVEGAPARSAEELVGVTAAAAATPSVVSSELLGRATDHSVTLKTSFDQSVNAYVEYGTSSGSYSQQTSTTNFADGMVEIVVSGLDTNSLYYYRLRYRAGTTGAFSAGSEHTFRTQRSRSSTFTFDIQSDSHQGFQAFYSSALYGVTMQNVANDHPDLFFDLGDTVSTDDTTETATTVNQKYAAQRTFFDMVAHSTPVYLVLGNHENEEGWNLDDFGTNVQNSLPVLGANGRKRYFSNPVPDGFYTGNSDPLAQIDGDHLRGDYYAFEWGSALFVAIDPFWYTTVKPYAGSPGGEKDDEVVGTRWNWTLGKAQYDWLDQTLSNSSAPFKFVFAHHPTGGTTDYVRGGALGAKYCEWGGYDTDGTTWRFDTQRPGWAMPVHNLLSERGVTAFFHGHDHVFAKEELDGVVYQECPHAANPDYGSGFSSNATDYAGAVLVNNSGHLRVTVSPTLVTVDYVRAYLPGDGTNASVAYTYTISPCRAAGSDGRACDDGNACTTGDVCAGGACSGHPLTCQPSDACHSPGVCDQNTGHCSTPSAPNGTPCSGGACVDGRCSDSPDAGASGGAGGAKEEAGAAGEGGRGDAHGGSSHDNGGSRATGGSSQHATGGSHATGGAPTNSTGGSPVTSGSSGAGGSSAEASGGSSGHAQAGTHGEAAAGGAETASAGSTGTASGGVPGGGRGGGGASGLVGSPGGKPGATHALPAGKDGGCACRVAEPRDAGASAWAAGGCLLVAFARRRRVTRKRDAGTREEERPPRRPPSRHRALTRRLEPSALRGRYRAEPRAGRR
jgi:hypothetical protein